MGAIAYSPRNGTIPGWLRALWMSTSFFILDIFCSLTVASQSLQYSLMHDMVWEGYLFTNRLCWRETFLVATRTRPKQTASYTDPNEPDPISLPITMSPQLIRCHGYIVRTLPLVLTAIWIIWRTTAIIRSFLYESPAMLSGSCAILGAKHRKEGHQPGENPE